ncbi:MAG: MgtC/SapB family protein [Bacteroidota bacterium]
MLGAEIEFQLMIRLGLALILGLLVGIERGWSFQQKQEGQRTAGVRTFTLIALAGGIWGILSEEVGAIVLGIVLLGFVIIIMAGYIKHAQQTGSLGLTTEMAAFVTFAIGILVVKGYIILSVASTIVMVLILSIKPELHKWVKTIEPNELYSGIIFLIISAVMLPLLPNRGYGPWDVFNPFELWGMVVLIAGLSYLGYYSMKYFGNEKGILFTSFTGSLVSSIAVTVTLGRFSGEVKSHDILVTGVLIAIFTALSRVLVWVVIFNQALLYSVGLSIGAMIVVTLALTLWVWWDSERVKQRKRFSLRNPLQLSTALEFGLILAVVMFLSEASKQWLGDPGIYGLSLISGMVDIDSITLSLLQMGGESLSNDTAGNGIIMASFSNTLIKSVIFAFFAGFKAARRLFLYCGIIVTTGLTSVLLI